MNENYLGVFAAQCSKDWDKRASPARIAISYNIMEEIRKVSVDKGKIELNRMRLKD
jgi:hypothetical protein